MCYSSNESVSALFHWNGAHGHGARPVQFLMLGVITIIFACACLCCVAAAVHVAGSKIRENRTFWQMQEKVTGCILVAPGLRLALEKRAHQCQRRLSFSRRGRRGSRRKTDSNANAAFPCDLRVRFLRSRLRRRWM